MRNCDLYSQICIHLDLDIEAAYNLFVWMGGEGGGQWKLSLHVHFEIAIFMKKNKKILFQYIILHGLKDGL